MIYQYFCQISFGELVAYIVQLVMYYAAKLLLSSSYGSDLDVTGMSVCWSSLFHWNSHSANYPKCDMC